MIMNCKIKIVNSKRQLKCTRFSNIFFTVVYAKKLHSLEFMCANSISLRIVIFEMICKKELSLLKKYILTMVKFVLQN